MTWDPKIFKLDQGPGTPTVGQGTRDPSCETQDFQFSIVLIFYSTLNPLRFTCYNDLYKINLFHGEYTEAAIAMYYKFERIKSSYLNFSEILGKKTVKEFEFI